MAVATTMLPATAEPADPAPLKRATGKVVSGQYIVVLKDGAEATTVAKRNRVSPKFVYTAAVDGFAAKLSRSELSRVRRDASVRYVEYDQIASKSDEPTTPPSTKSGPGTQRTQTGATWGIDRIDQRTGTNGVYNYTATGYYVTAYVIDTGIYTGHSEFSGRASVGIDTVGDGRNGQDCDGHGTHVAGTIGGKTWGVAKSVRLVAVRVLDCAGSGTYSGIIAGVDWVSYARYGPSVANMSLGGGYSQALNDAVTRSIGRGVSYVVAAGNSNDNACSYSPASTPAAVTVGATDLISGADVRASFSNYGSCLDVFAPGVDIRSAYLGSTSASAVLSGTSMASPHVAGLTALFLASYYYAAPAIADSVLKTTAVAGIVTDPAGSPNRFARKWNGVLASTGSNGYQPDGTYWNQVNTGYIEGWLFGTPGTDPNLYLERWTGTSWAIVARSESTAVRERVFYLGSGGDRFRFRVHAKSGGGTYDVFSTHPA